MTSIDSYGQFNEAIKKGITRFYDHSSNYKISIELIQKLAQSLNLDTFIDKDASAHLGPLNGQHFKRLTIAGNSILIDIDHTDDTTILNITLSSATQRTDDNLVESTIKSHEIIDSIHKVTLTEEYVSKLSLLKNRAEEIILQNISVKPDHTTLNKFPLNLKYMAYLDQMSLPQLNLFDYLDGISLLLSAINELDNEKEDITKMFIGKLQINDFENHEIGLFLHYWKDLRFIDKELNLNRSHCIKISIRRIDNNELNPVEKETPWIINESKYLFEMPIFKEEDKYMFNFEFKTPIVVPKLIFEYLELTNSEFDEINIPECFQEINDHQFTKYQSDDYSLSIHVKYPQHFVIIKSTKVYSLHKLQELIPVLRSIHVFNSIVNSIVSQGSFVKYSDPDTQLKKNLKESLKLGEGITNEELMGINLGNENSGMVLKTLEPTTSNSISLNEFISEEVPSPSKEEPFLRLSLDDVILENYSSFVFKVDGMNEDHNIHLKFQIVNGEIIPYKDNDNEQNQDQNQDQEMDIDAGVVGQNNLDYKFIKALNLTEDFLKSIKHVYN